MKRFNNDMLKKYKFNIDSVKLFDSFAGIGALHRALERLGVPVKLTGISEVEIDAIINYAAIHIEDYINKTVDYPSETEMREWLINRNIGWDFVKGKSSIPSLKKDKLYEVYKASILTNNYGDISLINYDELEDFDLFNFSFACTDISVAGKRKGFVDDDGKETRTGMYKYGIDLIKSKKPKYIMIENVKNLIGRNFIHKFYEMIEDIESFGYKCYYPTKDNDPRHLNSEDYGIPQSRERIFVICIRNDVDNGFEFPQGFDSKLRLIDLLEEDVDSSYNVNADKTAQFVYNTKGKIDWNKKVVGTCHVRNDLSFATRDRVSNAYMVSPTLSATQYKDPVKIIYREKYGIRLRKMTPRETWRLMGFDDECFDKVKELGKTSNSSLYKQSGNSIVVNVLYYIFKELFKIHITI